MDRRTRALVSRITDINFHPYQRGGPWHLRACLLVLVVYPFFRTLPAGRPSSRHVKQARQPCRSCQRRESVVLWVGTEKGALTRAEELTGIMAPPHAPLGPSFSLPDLFAPAVRLRRSASRGVVQVVESDRLLLEVAPQCPPRQWGVVFNWFKWASIRSRRLAEISPSTTHSP